jgi:flagellar biosynthesis GTPase FlhF
MLRYEFYSNFNVYHSFFYTTIRASTETSSVNHRSFNFALFNTCHLFTTIPYCLYFSLNIVSLMLLKFLIFFTCFFNFTRVAYISNEKDNEREKIKARKIWEGILLDQEEKEREEKEREEKEEERDREKDRERDREREKDKERDREREREREKERIWSKESRDQVCVLIL